MSIRIESPAEAFAAIASVVIAADSMGTMTERNAVLGRLKETPALSGQDNAALTALLSKVTGHLCDKLPVSESGSFTSVAVDQVIAAVKSVLGPEQRALALKLAEATMDSDGASDSERALLTQLRAGLS
jgi:tellurite resistance protein